MAMSWHFEDLVRLPVVFVDHAAETSASSYPSVHRDHDGRVVVRW
jgi:hypothetical protein